MQQGDVHWLHACAKLSGVPEQVFIPEQQLYTKQELDRHLKSGDTAGPLAESGFKGHPQCRFCRKRFYGDSELFLHMQVMASAPACSPATGLLPAWKGVPVTPSSGCSFQGSAATISG